MVYAPFAYLLSPSSEGHTKEFLVGERDLIEYAKKVNELYALKSSALNMDLHIPMELFSLDCSLINEVGFYNEFVLR